MELFSKSCESIYLGWDQPLLDGVSAELRQRFAKGSQLNLSDIDCVLPSLHSCRRLRSLLEKNASEGGLALKLPRMMTVGQLTDHLYTPSARLASDFEQTLAWARALKTFSSDELKSLTSGAPPEESLVPWFELAGKLSALALDLSSHQLNFRQVQALATDGVERARWDLLSRIRKVYLKELREASLADPIDERSSALVEQRCEAERLTILIGTSDLSDEVLGLLRAVPKNLVAMIGAPEDSSHLFNEFGSVVSAKWKDYRLSMTGEPFCPAGDMMDQAAAVASQVRNFASDYTVDQVSIGVTDDSHVAPIEMELRGCGVQVHRNLGWLIKDTSVGRLLQLTTHFIARGTWQSLAALVRHHHVHQWLTEKLDQPLSHESESWHTQLDQFIANHFPVRVTDAVPEVALDHFPKLSKLRDLVLELLHPFLTEAKTVSDWSDLILRWLGDFFGQQDSTIRKEISDLCLDEPGMNVAYPVSPFKADDDALPETSEDALTHRTRGAIRAAAVFLRHVSELSPSLDVTCSGDVALDMLTNRIGYLRVPDATNDSGIEVLGWLDLALDTSPALVVNGFNHPYVPSVVSADAFLPAELKQRLPTEVNERRFARDLYTTQLILKSRRSVSFIVGKEGVDSNPTPPSRLLAAPKREDLPERLLNLLEGTRNTVPALHQWDSQVSKTRIEIPDLGNLTNGVLPAVESLSVTAFRDYLVCPYRFFLRHVLKLRPVEDTGGELAANQFGDLIHGALEDYGKSDDRDESDPEAIEFHLKKYLHGYVERWYAKHASSAVQIQVAQAEKRLKAVSRVQARRVEEGWLIHEAEASVGSKQGARIEVDGQSLPIKGRFDRIDVRRQNGCEEWAILDYKTHGHPPEKKHLKKTAQGVTWIDLQLPLYRMMVPYLGIQEDPSRVRLGYFNIGAKDEETKINEASFSEDLMQQAESLVKDCVRNILAGKFEPSNHRVDYDDYESILQTGVASRLLSLATRDSGERD